MESAERCKLLRAPPIFRMALIIGFQVPVCDPRTDWVFVLLVERSEVALIANSVDSEQSSPVKVSLGDK